MSFKIYLSLASGSPSFGTMGDTLNQIPSLVLPKGLPYAQRPVDRTWTCSYPLSIITLPFLPPKPGFYVFALMHSASTDTPSSLFKPDWGSGLLYRPLQANMQAT